MKKDLVTVSQLANLSGITPRTIRYYDKIDLLKPTLIDKNGYRKYNLKQLNRLQQILYFKQFGFELARIKTMIDADDYNIVVSLEHQQALLAKEVKRKQILLDNLKQTVKYYKGEINMTNLEKFKVFKNELIMQNEEKYGKEVSEKYGEVKHQQGIEKFKNLTESDYQISKDLEHDLIKNLDQINESNLPINSELGKLIFEQHQQWLKIFNDKYTKDYHLAMATLYETDKRFAKHYNSQSKTDVTATLTKIIRNYAK